MNAHKPADYDVATVYAIRALAEGKATEGQQKTALDWIINHASGLYDLSYRPGGTDGDRATVFHEGRRFVGSQIVKMTRPETLKAAQAAEAKRAKPAPAEKPKE